MTTKILSGGYSGVYNLTSPVTTLSITASGYLAGGLMSAGVNTYTIVNDGHVRGATYGIQLAGAGVVTNAGHIISSSTTSGVGVVMGDGGNVTNEAGAVISGYYGIDFGAQAGTVNNQGLILGSGKYGVKLAAGGLVTNGGAADTTATVRGDVAIGAILSATVHNFGTIAAIGTTGVAVYLAGGGEVTNGSATDTKAIILAPMIGMIAHTSVGTLINYGVVEGVGTASAGAAVEAGGTIVNGSATDTTALIKGNGFGVAALNVAGTVNNFGTIIGGYGIGGVQSGAYLKNGGVVNNGSSKDFTAHIGGGIVVAIISAPGTVDNFGTLGGVGAEVGVDFGGGAHLVNGSASDTAALIQAYIGVAVTTQTGTVHNYGTILSGGGPGDVTKQEAGVLLVDGGLVTNGSSLDTKAAMTGGTFGVYATTLTATVSNFGDISGSEAGLFLLAGGKVTNGSTADTKANIYGPLAGVVIEGGPGTVLNFGTIVGVGLGQFGVVLTSAGVITNGSSTDHAATIRGFLGVDAISAAVKVSNFGTLSGENMVGSFGAVISSSGVLTNNAGALITGGNGIDLGNSATVTNFGTIQATAGFAVNFADPTARLNAEAGSVIVGTIDASGGLVDVVSGVATASAIVTAGKLEGAGTLSLAGGGSYFDAGASLLVSKIELSGATTEARVEAKLADARVWDQAGGTLFVDSGDQIGFTGTGNSFTGTITGPGTVALSGGSDTLANVTLSAGKMTISKSTVTLSGTIDLTKTVTVTSPALIVAAAGATLAGGGEILLSNTAANSLHGASSAATLTNDDIIAGAGHLGGGTMVLVNGASGVIESAYATPLTIDTGANTVSNAGLIEAKAGGGVVIAGAVDNAGTLESLSGPLAVDGAVSGSGIAKVIGGVMTFASTFSQNVTFGSSGRLVLSHSQAYGGTISGFSHTGATSLDLGDIAFSGGTTATYSGTAAAGILTVSDGTHTAHIHFTGNYTTATWTLSAATGGGVHVIDPTQPRPPALPMATAMAGFGAGGGGAAASGSAPITGPPILAAPTH
ncbi:MAG TPA: hypothetical protein VGH15_02660 [Caulobacteraceae bacterium]